jgi:phage portal protein BeeE
MGLPLAPCPAPSRDVAQAFGVPPQLLGIPGDNTYSNYQEARLALWEETVIPLLRHLRDEFNAWLSPRFGEGLALEIDLDEIPALALRREKTWDRIQAADFLTLNEKRALAGFTAVPGGDIHVLRRGEEVLDPGRPKPEGESQGRDNGAAREDGA